MRARRCVRACAWLRARGAACVWLRARGCGWGRARGCVRVGVDVPHVERRPRHTDYLRPTAIVTATTALPAPATWQVPIHFK